jgi:hypothetical protein
MKWVRDTTGRLAERPHYAPDELDAECESLIHTFLRRKHLAVGFPISTDDLSVLLEQETADLDLYADLSAEGHAVEGVTEFAREGKPSVRISAALSEAADERDAGKHRLRSTIAHELGHVRLHAFLWRMGGLRGVRCLRDSLLNARQGDWLEWQAGYAAGAYLMPAGALRAVANATTAPAAGSPLFFRTAAARSLVRRVAADFEVSQPAAQVRLLQTGYLTRDVPAHLAANATLRRVASASRRSCVSTGR